MGRRGGDLSIGGGRYSASLFQRLASSAAEAGGIALIDKKPVVCAHVPHFGQEEGSAQGTSCTIAHSLDAGGMVGTV